MPNLSNLGGRMTAGTLLYFMTQVLILIAAAAVLIALLRWALRINEIIALLQEVLAHLRHINANTKPDP